MKFILHATIVTFAISVLDGDVDKQFQQFQAAWNLTYHGNEYKRRAAAFNTGVAQMHKAKKDEYGTATYSHLSPFLDRLPHETMTGARPELARGTTPPPAPRMSTNLNVSFDWVEKGAVNPIRYQGQCGSCWAFSTVCNLEGTTFVQLNELYDLSEQNMVDCSKSNYACGGGWVSVALEWSAESGITTEVYDPYVDTTATVNTQACTQYPSLVQNSAYFGISTDETQIAQALVHYGPLALCLCADTLYSYTGGVINSTGCGGQIDHCVNLVGYGVDTKSDGSEIDYWRLRNSWSTWWGEQGYFRLIRGSCMCSMCKNVLTATGLSISSSYVAPPSDADAVEETTVTTTTTTVTTTVPVSGSMSLVDEGGQVKDSETRRVVRSHRTTESAKLVVDAQGDIEAM